MRVNISHESPLHDVAWPLGSVAASHRRDPCADRPLCCGVVEQGSHRVFLLRRIRKSLLPIRSIRRRSCFKVIDMFTS